MTAYSLLFRGTNDVLTNLRFCYSVVLLNIRYTNNICRFLYELKRLKLDNMIDIGIKFLFKNVNNYINDIFRVVVT